MSGVNTDREALKEYVERLFNVEREFEEAKNERGDFRKDLKEEIKGKHDATGIEFAEVDRLVKIKLDEMKMREKVEQENTDLATYDILYGKPDEDPLG